MWHVTMAYMDGRTYVRMDGWAVHAFAGNQIVAAMGLRWRKSSAINTCRLWKRVNIWMDVYLPVFKISHRTCECFSFKKTVNYF